MSVPLWHNTSLPLHIHSRQTVSGMHIRYPSTNAMSCHGEWRRATERERERENEHMGLDSAIYKAWPSACLINCALFWEIRKPAGRQERGRQSERKRIYIYIPFLSVSSLSSVAFLTHLQCLQVFHHHLSSKPSPETYDTRENPLPVIGVTAHCKKYCVVQSSFRQTNLLMGWAKKDCM